MVGERRAGAAASVVLGFDVGRTTCRAALVDAADATEHRSEVPSGASLADAGGVATLATAIVAAAAALGVEPGDPRVRGLGVGVTGAAQARAAAADLHAELQGRFPGAGVRVTSDVVTAHLGALDGLPGVVCIVGTGAVALGVSASGTLHLVDGWGYLLGDAGSGAAIGRAGLGAALRWLDGRDGGSRWLADAAVSRFGPLDELVTTIHADPFPVRAAASFAADVVAGTRAGDDVATAILRDAVDALADTVRAAVAAVSAADPGSTRVPVAVTGGLGALDDLVVAPLARAVTATHPVATVVPPVGDGLAGALRVASHAAGADDPLVERVTAPTVRAARPRPPLAPR